MVWVPHGHWRTRWSRGPVGERRPRCWGRSTLSGTAFGVLADWDVDPGVVVALDPRRPSETPLGSVVPGAAGGGRGRSKHRLVTDRMP